MSETAQTPHESESTGRVKPGVLTWLVWFLFALLFAFLIWQAISTLFFPDTYLSVVREASAGLFVALAIAGIAVPPALAALAYALGRKRGVGIKALLLLTALAATPAITQSIYALGTLVLTVG